MIIILKILFEHNIQKLTRKKVIFNLYKYIYILIKLIHNKFFNY